MHYLLLIYLNESRWAELLAEDQQRLLEESEAFKQETIKTGQFRSCAALHSSVTATTVRQRHGKAVITDGPFAETKEIMAGYLGVECRDLGEAIALAARMPIQQAGGAVEIRPVNAPTS
jgi:hypothetical protein